MVETPLSAMKMPGDERDSCLRNESGFPHKASQGKPLLKTFLRLIVLTVFVFMGLESICPYTNNCTLLFQYKTILLGFSSHV